MVPYPGDSLVPAANSVDVSTPDHLCKVDNEVECLAPDPIVALDPADDAVDRVALEFPNGDKLLNKDTMEYLANKRKEDLAAALDANIDEESGSSPAEELRNVLVPTSSKSTRGSSLLSVWPRDYTFCYKHEGCHPGPHLVMLVQM
jgi:hypothetical protein